jgi:hypothetical protein
MKKLHQVSKVSAIHGGDQSDLLVLGTRFVSASALRSRAYAAALLHATCSVSGIVERRTLCARAQPPSTALDWQNSYWGIGNAETALVMNVMAIQYEDAVWPTSLSMGWMNFLRDRVPAANDARRRPCSFGPRQRGASSSTFESRVLAAQHYNYFVLCTYYDQTTLLAFECSVMALMLAVCSAGFRTTSRAVVPDSSPSQVSQ